MKKVVVICALLACIFIFSGCVKGGFGYPMTVLYDAEGVPVQAVVSFAYDLKQNKDGSYYIDLCTKNGNVIKQSIDITANYIEIQEKISMSDFSNYNGGVAAPRSGENAYTNRRVANMYYLDRYADRMALVVTDQVNGEVECCVLRAALFEGGEQGFICSDGQGNYQIVFASREADRDALAQLPEYMPESTYEAEVNLIGSSTAKIGDYTYDVIKDENNRSCLAIYTTMNEYIYVAIDMVIENGDVLNPSFCIKGVPYKILAVDPGQ